MENEVKTNRLIISEWITTLGVFLGCFYLLFSEMKAIECRLDARISEHQIRADFLYERLYEQKADSDQKWADLLIKFTESQTKK